MILNKPFPTGTLLGSSSHTPHRVGYLHGLAPPHLDKLFLWLYTEMEEGKRKIEMDDLESRVRAFQTCQLPWQPTMLHPGTLYLINDLWEEVKRLRAELPKQSKPHKPPMRAKC